MVGVAATKSREGHGNGDFGVVRMVVYIFSKRHPLLRKGAIRVNMYLRGRYRSWFYRVPLVLSLPLSRPQA